METKIQQVVIQEEWDVAEPMDVCLLPIDRHTIAKRRWRQLLSEDLEVVYKLQVPSSHGALLLGSDGKCYKLQQNAEDVIAIPMPGSLEMAAKVGWYLGNQHLGIEVREKEILLEDVHTLARSLEKIGIPFERREDVFLCALHSSHSH
ncbi:hypothetical protein ACFPK9_07555 [Rubritalea spongiae]|uniref:Urease accessory protein UreE C-terminal domain-containing protein n=1 Tax=Rubritalea spongiae TaxID=430797 RepID=A0ABW5DZQ2_9BACT